MINFIKQAVESVEGIKSFLFNTDYRNNFDLQNVKFPCCVLTPIMRTNYDLNNIIHESAELQLSVVETAPYEYTGDDLYAINKRCSDLALQVIANLQVKSKLDKELTFEFILPSGDEFISGVMCNLTATMKQGSCIGKPSYVEIVVQPIKRESITSNGKHIISADSGYNAMREVEIDVQVVEKADPKLQSKEITISTNNSTTDIVADEGFDGLEKVSVSVDVEMPTTEEKSVTITSNGEVEILPTNADAMAKVTANVQVPPPPLEEKQVTITEAKTTEIITPDAEYGLSRVEVSTDIPLESKQITITENGTTTIEASEGFEGIESVEVTTDVNTLQGLDFSEIYDAEQADKLNQLYRDGIKYAEEFRKAFAGGSGWVPFFAKENLNLLFVPKGIDISGYTRMDQTFYNASRLVCVAEDFNPINSINNQLLFANCSSLIKIKINSPKNTSCYSVAYNCMACEYIDLGDCGNVTNWTTAFSAVWFCPTIIFRNWKFGNVPIPNTRALSPESIHYIIQNAMDVADGATVRTLTLHATAKTNWQNSEYYEQDLAVLSTKGITIV